MQSCRVKMMRNLKWESSKEEPEVEESSKGEGEKVSDDHQLI